MRVIFIGLDWPPETFIRRLLTGLTRSGIEITVACNRKPENKWLAQPNCKWLWTPEWNCSLLRRAFCGFLLLFKALIKRPWGLPHLWRRVSSGSSLQKLWTCYHYLPFLGGRWDVVYFPWNSAAIAYLPLFENTCPLVVSCRGSQVNIAPHDPDRVKIIAGLQTTFHRAAAVHCVSRAIQEEAQTYGLDPVKAWVIRPAVDPEFFFPADKHPIEKKFRIVITGTLIWTKGYEYSLAALRLLFDQDILAELHIIGSGPEHARVFYTIDDLGLNQQVYLHGKLPPSKVRQQLQQADVFLLSSLSEGISNAVLEAMACGLPVVTTDCGGMREAVIDGVEGFVVPVRDPDAMAMALVRLAGDPALRKTMGQAARQRVVEDFSLKDQIQSFVKLFETVRKKSQLGLFG